MGRVIMRCKECGEEFLAITNSHLAKHNLTMSEYAEKYNLSMEELKSEEQLESGNVQTAESIQKRKNTLEQKRIKEYGSYNNLTYEEEQVILGTLIGDAYLEYTNRSALKCDHSIMQLKYLKWKAYMLQRFNTKVFQRFFYNPVAQRYTARQYLRTASAQPFKDLAKHFYPTNREKEATREIMDRLDDLGLAVWYMDDGMRCGNNMHICYENFSNEEREMIRNWFSEQGIETHEIRRKHLVIDSKEKFINKIKNHILPLFSYKIPDHKEVQKARISKSIDVECSHFLCDYEGKCNRQHGHQLKITIVAEGCIDPHTGMVMDFGYLKDIMNKYIKDVLDHNNVNNVINELKFRPTSEKLACWIWMTLREMIPGLREVHVHETPTSCLSLIDADDNLVKENLEWNNRMWDEIVEKNPDIVKYRPIGVI